MRAKETRKKRSRERKVEREREREWRERFGTIPKKRLRGCTKARRMNFEAFLHKILQTEGISLSQLVPLLLVRLVHSLERAQN